MLYLYYKAFVSHKSMIRNRVFKNNVYKNLWKSPCFLLLNCLFSLDKLIVIWYNSNVKGKIKIRQCWRTDVLV